MDSKLLSSNLSNFNISLNQIKCFAAVSEFLNFSEAAKVLYVPQSAVSQQIALLEGKLGVKLFFRDKRTVALTNAGKVFLKYTLNILNETETAIEDVRRAQEGYIGSITIGFLAGPVMHFLPALMKSFSNKYPTIEIKLRHLTTQQLNEKIHSNELDIVFTVLLGTKANNKLETKFLYSSKICAYLSEYHPFANYESIPLANLSEENFVLRDRKEVSLWYDYTIDLCVENGFYPQIIAEPQRIEAIMIYVDSRLGITILPDYLKFYATPSIKLIPIECSGNSVDVVAYRNVSNKNPSLSLFYEELIHMFENPL